MLPSAIYYVDISSNTSSSMSISNLKHCVINIFLKFDFIFNKQITRNWRFLKSWSKIEENFNVKRKTFLEYIYNIPILSRHKNIFYYA